MSRHQVLKSALDRISSCHLSVITSCLTSNINQIPSTDKQIRCYGNRLRGLLPSCQPGFPVDYQTRRAPEPIGRDTLHLKNNNSHYYSHYVYCYDYFCLSKLLLLYYTLTTYYYNILYYTNGIYYALNTIYYYTSNQAMNRPGLLTVIHNSSV